MWTPGEESGVGFALGNDELDVADRLSELLVKEFGEHFRVDCKPRIYETQSGSHTLYLSNKVVADYFKKWCGKYAWGKKLPPEAMFLPISLQAIILKNCIKGDGGTIESRGYTLELKSRDLIQQLMWFSWRLNLLPTYKETGVLPRYTEMNIKDGFEIYTDPNTGKKSRPGYIIRFSVRDSKTLNDFLQDTDIRISSKKSKRVTNIFEFENNKYFVSKIDKIERVNVPCQVYNIEVEGDNSYVAEGVIVHNCEHVQIPELSKGKVVDAVLREIPIGKSASGEDLTTYYVDLLIATDRKHEDLIRKIESGEMNTLSMGCRILYSQCSKCGNKSVDETQACQHVKYEKNNFFYDDNGVQRRVAELCGHKSDPESVVFCDASWVKNPAFVGAVRRCSVEPSLDIISKIEAALDKKSYQPKEGDYLKAAAHLIAQDKPPAGKEPPADEPPADEPPADDKAPAEAEAPAAEAPAPAEEAPEEGGLPEEEEPGDDMRKMKDQIKKRILQQISDEIADDFTEKEERPQELETLDESIIKPASVYRNLWNTKTVWDRFVRKTAGNLDEKAFNKLKYGAHILLTRNKPTVLADYGFGKRDFLAVLSYLDSVSPNPLSVVIKAAVAKLGGTNKKSSVELLGEIVNTIGRKLSKEEARRSLVWLNMLDAYRK